MQKVKELLKDDSRSIEERLQTQSVTTIDYFISQSFQKRREYLQANTGSLFKFFLLKQ